MEPMTTVLSTDPARRPLATSRALHQPDGPSAGRLMSTAVAAAGGYAQRAGATWLLWLRTHSHTLPHEDF